MNWPVRIGIKEARIRPFLLGPDKAIDLVDEAAAALAIQIGSVPVEIDDLECRATSLEIERNALKREDDANSRKRLVEVERELAQTREQAAGLRARWQKEKGAIGEIAALKERLERMRFEATEAMRKGDLQRAAELQYGEIPKTERELASAQDEAVAETKSGGGADTHVSEARPFDFAQGRLRAPGLSQHGKTPSRLRLSTLWARFNGCGVSATLRGGADW